MKLLNVSAAAALAGMTLLGACDQPMSETATTAMTGTPEENCTAEVSNRTGTSSVNVVNSQASEAGMTVTLGATGSDGVWTCITDEDGRVAEVVHSTGDMR